MVFEDLELGDFFNRIPALTFEVIADEGPISLADMVGGVIADCDADLPLDRRGRAIVARVRWSKRCVMLEPLFPMDCDVGGERR